MITISTKITIREIIKKDINMKSLIEKKKKTKKEKR